jgi:hypothetical protein
MRGFPLILLLFGAQAFAADEPTPRCADEDVYGVLDFWIGEWDVYVDDKLVGENRIEKILSGCAVLEHWRGAGGGEGKSLFYVSGRGTWKQVWVTEWATRPGGVKEKTLQVVETPDTVRFQGRMVLPDGGSYLDRTTLTRLASGEVRQVIETSTDDGESWTAGFDAIYRRRN